MEKFDKSIFAFGAQVDMTDAEFKEAVQPSPDIEPYQRTKLTILMATKPYAAKTDSTWLNIGLRLGLKDWTMKMEAGEDGVEKPVFYDEKGKKKRSLYHTLQVPTSRVQYFSKKGEDTPFVFRNTQEFFGALGHDLLPSNMAKVIPSVFDNEMNLDLVGVELDVLPGYEDKHIARAKDGTYYVADRNGKAIKLVLEGVEIPNSYEDRATAEAEAIACNHDIDMSKTSMKVLKFFPAAEPFKPKGKAKTTFDD